MAHIPSLKPVTLLEAVNSILFSIGEPPVNTLEAPQRLDVVQAEQAIDMVNRSVQKRGWYFNTEPEVQLTLDGSNHLPLAENVLAAKVSEVSLDSGSIHYVMREDGGTRKLYDRKNRTFVFSSAPKVDQVVFLDFEVLPEAARNYIFRRAGINFQIAQVSSELVYRFLERDAATAWAEMMQDEINVERFNLDQSSYANAILYQR